MNQASEQARVEPATIEDLEELTELVMELLQLEEDFVPDRTKQEHGLRLILEQPNRGRIFALRSADRIIGMANMLFTISTAEGGFVLLLEDVIVHPDHRGQGLGSLLIEEVIKFAEKREFLRITLLTDKVTEKRSQEFFRHHGFKDSSMMPMRRSLQAE